MPQAILIGVVGAAAGFLIPEFFRKTIGTRYRTEDACQDCETRRAVDHIRALVVELAIKAGVPAEEVAKLVNNIGHKLKR